MPAWAARGTRASPGRAGPAREPPSPKFAFRAPTPPSPQNLLFTKRPSPSVLLTRRLRTGRQPLLQRSLDRHRRGFGLAAGGRIRGDAFLATWPLAYV